MEEEKKKKMKIEFFFSVGVQFSLAKREMLLKALKMMMTMTVA